MIAKQIKEQAKGSVNYKKVKVNEIKAMPIGKADKVAEHREGRAKVYVMQSGQKKKQAKVAQVILKAPGDAYLL